MIQCPECRNQFERSGSGNRIVHYCRSCGKAWLAYSVLRALVRDAVNAAGIAKKVIGFTEAVPRPLNVYCPACGLTFMQQVELRGVTVARCATCKGILLERGQFLTIVRRVVDAEKGWAIAEADWADLYQKLRLEMLKYRQTASNPSAATLLGLLEN
jgi:Zn-finger nucleic acid-binding protein